MAEELRVDDEAPLYDQFVLFGDSITEFGECQDRGFAFAAALRNSYIRKLEVVNRGFSGYNTDLALRVLARAIPKPSESKIALMTIFFGANDSCFPTERNNQCVPLPEFRSNLIKIINSHSITAHNPKLILITNPPVDERTQYAMDLERGFPMRRTSENTMKYAVAIKAVGRSLGIPVVDIWSEIMLKAGWEPGSTENLPGCHDVPPNEVLREYLFDGLHLADPGYRLLHQMIMDCISSNWPDMLPENLPWKLPRWDDGDAWRLRGETDSIIQHRPRVLPSSAPIGDLPGGAESASNGVNAGDITTGRLA